MPNLGNGVKFSKMHKVGLGGWKIYYTIREAKSVVQKIKHQITNYSQDHACLSKN